MSGNQRGHEEWAMLNISRFERCRNRLLMRDYAPDQGPTLLLQCYRNLYGAEINFLDADIPGEEFRQYGYVECKRLRLNFAILIENAMLSGAHNIELSSAVASALRSPSLRDQLDGC